MGAYYFIYCTLQGGYKARTFYNNYFKLFLRTPLLIWKILKLLLNSKL